MYSYTEYQELDEGFQEWKAWLTNALPAIWKRYAHLLNQIRSMGEKPTEEQFIALGKAAAPNGEKAFLAGLGVGTNASRQIESVLNGTASLLFEMDEKEKEEKENRKSATLTLFFLAQLAWAVCGVVYQGFNLASSTLGPWGLIGVVVWAIGAHFIRLWTIKKHKGELNKIKPRQARKK